MSQEVLERLREASVPVFGNRYRAELMLALASADGRGVCLGDLAIAQEVPHECLSRPDAGTGGGGLGTEAAADGGERRRWYRRSDDDALWQCLAGLLSCLAQVPVPVRVG